MEVSPSCSGALAGAELRRVKQKEQPIPFEIQRQKPGRQTQLPAQQLLLPAVPRKQVPPKHHPPGGRAGNDGGAGGLALLPTPLEWPTLTTNHISCLSPLQHFRHGSTGTAPRIPTQGPLDTRICISWPKVTARRARCPERVGILGFYKRNRHPAEGSVRQPRR